MEFNKNIPEDLILPQLKAIDKLIKRYSDVSEDNIKVISRVFGDVMMCPLCTIFMKNNLFNQEICLNCIHSKDKYFGKCIDHETYQNLMVNINPDTIIARRNFYIRLRKEYINHYKITI